MSVTCGRFGRPLGCLENCSFVLLLFYKCSKAEMLCLILYNKLKIYIYLVPHEAKDVMDTVD